MGPWGALRMSSKDGGLPIQRTPPARSICMARLLPQRAKPEMTRTSATLIRLALKLTPGSDNRMTSRLRLQRGFGFQALQVSRDGGDRERPAGELVRDRAV